MTGYDNKPVLLGGWVGKVMSFMVVAARTVTSILIPAPKDAMLWSWWGIKAALGNSRSGCNSHLQPPNY